jgi:hypothetical protein
VAVPVHPRAVSLPVRSPHDCLNCFVAAKALFRFSRVLISGRGTTSGTLIDSAGEIPIAEI